MGPGYFNRLSGRVTYVSSQNDNGATVKVQISASCPIPLATNTNLPPMKVWSCFHCRTPLYLSILFFCYAQCALTPHALHQWPPKLPGYPGICYSFCVNDLRKNQQLQCQHIHHPLDPNKNKQTNHVIVIMATMSTTRNGLVPGTHVIRGAAEAHSPFSKVLWWLQPKIGGSGDN